MTMGCVSCGAYGNSQHSPLCGLITGRRFIRRLAPGFIRYGDYRAAKSTNSDQRVEPHVKVGTRWVVGKYA